MARPLMVYFHKQPTFNHHRRVYIAARSKAQAHRISGISVDQLGYGQSIEAGTGWAPTFIKDEGVWMEIRDHAEEGHLYADKFHEYGTDRFRADVHDIAPPSNEAAWIRCATLDACKETFTLLIDRALKAAGHPLEPLQATTVQPMEAP